MSNSSKLCVQGPEITFQDGGVAIWKEGADKKKDDPFIFVTMDMMISLMRRLSFNKITHRYWQYYSTPVTRHQKPKRRWVSILNRFGLLKNDG